MAYISNKRLKYRPFVSDKPLVSRSAHTRHAILEAAEALFARQGHDGTSIRQIAALSKTNLSAVNYHFGSKDGLIRAVFQRRLDAINNERLLQLTMLQKRAEGRPLKPSHIVEAFFGPLIRHAFNTGPDHAAFFPLLQRNLSDRNGLITTLFLSERNNVFSRFKAALLESLPGVPTAEITWRIHFMLGATSYAIMGADVLRQAMGLDREDMDDNKPDKLLQKLLSFLLGGLRAPLPQTTNTTMLESSAAPTAPGACAYANGSSPS
ncbi:MAG: TetR family transcriptional regulator [Candidimonas sp.]|jgi:AcrR family transcriptional regulator